MAGKLTLPGCLAAGTPGFTPAVLEKMQKTGSVSLHAVVNGRVQGVFFRAYVSRRAMELGLKGWVRNLENGDVEVRAEGERAALERLLGYLHTGPPSAVVTSVDTVWGEGSGCVPGFSISY